MLQAKLQQQSLVPQLVAGTGPGAAAAASACQDGAWQVQEQQLHKLVLSPMVQVPTQCQVLAQQAAAAARAAAVAAAAYQDGARQEEVSSAVASCSAS